jgi:hypothetical protein
MHVSHVILEDLISRMRARSLAAYAVISYASSTSDSSFLHFFLKMCVCGVGWGAALPPVPPCWVESGIRVVTRNHMGWGGTSISIELPSMSCGCNLVLV